MFFLFEDNLDYQRAAVDAVVDLFGDREASEWEKARDGAFPNFDPEVAPEPLAAEGVAGNRLPISAAALLENLRDVQRRNGLPRSASLSGRNFTVEMETGTGKTYVYLRTLFELNRRYGLTKFIVVVPSVAIKEGVSKTLEITRDHFAARYPAVRGMEWFVHDSRKPGQIRNFAASPAIQIMIVTAAAINKRDVNTLYKENEKTGGERPLDLIRAVRPVLVVDEPQSVDGGLSGRGKEALEGMDPLFTLRYSATHRDLHAMVYRLDAVDAYQRGLVKQIEVAALEIRRSDGDRFLRPGEAGGDAAAGVQRLMIRRTIREHLERENQFVERGLEISVLTLFFIDSVRFYRDRDDRGNPIPGKYARMFEEEFRALAAEPDFRTTAGKILGDGEIAEIHNGYFSIDKRGNWTESADGGKIHRENAERAYRRIMREKEKLLSPDNRLKFIFSHSALREGWDNPNVFQICALREMGTERERRQTIGRGLRLCVDHRGRRLRDPAVNTLTVVANERYEDFARNLQREIEADTGIRFGVLRKDHFADLLETDLLGAAEKDAETGAEDAEALWNFLREADFIDPSGRIRRRLRNALSADRLELPERFRDRAESIAAALRKIAGPFRVGNADRREAETGEPALEREAAFRRLWQRLSANTRCRIEFDPDRLIAEAARALREAPPLLPIRARFRKAAVSLSADGAKSRAIQTGRETAAPDEAPGPLPDLLTELARRTGLTRRTLATILRKSGRLADFPKNPRLFIERAAAAIAGAKRRRLGAGIRYRSLPDGGFARERLDAGDFPPFRGDPGPVAEFSAPEGGPPGESEPDRPKTAENGLIGGKPPARFAIPTPLGRFRPAWVAARRTAAGEIIDFLSERPSSSESAPPVENEETNRKVSAKSKRVDKIPGFL